MVIVNVVVVVIVVFVFVLVVMVRGGDCRVIGGSGDCYCRRGSSDMVEMLYCIYIVTRGGIYDEI